MTKRLCKSRTNKMICGVCGGIAEYCGVDPTVVRLAYVAFSFFVGSGILLYLICAIVMPNEY